MMGVDNHWHTHRQLQTVEREKIVTLGYHAFVSRMSTARQELIGRIRVSVSKLTARNLCPYIWQKLEK